MVLQNRLPRGLSFAVILFLASTANKAAAFQASLVSSRIVSRSFDTAIGPVAKDIEPSPLSYSEKSRLYRRDFYDHDSWLKHRAKNRFVGTLSKVLDSGVVRQLADEVILIGAVATFVCVFNALCVTGYEDFSNLHHDPIFNFGAPLVKLPGEPFSLSSPALSLLLVFKTNTSYQRWDEARKAWGVIVNNSRTVIRETSAWVLQSDLSDEEKYRLIRRVADCVWLFPRSLQRHLLNPAEDEEAYVKDVRAKLDPVLAEDLVSARHRPTRAMYEMSKAVNTLPLDSYQRSTIDQGVSQLCDACGGCERIFGSPVPSIYTRHAARFIELWMFFLPLALYSPFSISWNHWFMIPSSMIIGFFLLGIEELAIQLEEPFSVLPLGKIASGIGLSAEEHVQWAEEQMAIDRTSGPSSYGYPAPIPESTVVSRGPTYSTPTCQLQQTPVPLANGGFSYLNNPSQQSISTSELDNDESSYQEPPTEQRQPPVVATGDYSYLNPPALSEDGQPQNGGLTYQFGPPRRLP